MLWGKGGKVSLKRYYMVEIHSYNSLKMTKIILIKKLPKAREWGMDNL